MGIDGVVPQGPEKQPRIQKPIRHIQPACLCRKAQQRAPVEGQPQPGLRPPGDAFHEGIGQHQQQRGRAQKDREPVELQQNDQPDQAQRHDKDGRLPHRHRAGRNGPPARARHLGVNLAVHNIVEGAARAAHHDGAQPEQDHIIKVAPFIEDALIRHRPQHQPEHTGPEQQPAADGTVQPHQLGIGFHARGQGREPMGGNGVCRGLRGTVHAG